MIMLLLDSKEAEQAFTLRARTALHSLLTLAASQRYGSAQYVPKVFSRHEGRRLKIQLKRPLEFAVNVCALCSPCWLCAPAFFTRCWSNAASCRASSVSVSSLSCVSLNPLMLISRRRISPRF